MNLASMGRLIEQNGYKVRHWDERGLKFVDPEGTEVPTAVVNYVPRLIGECAVLEEIADDIATAMNATIDCTMETVEDIASQIAAAIQRKTNVISDVKAEYNKEVPPSHLLTHMPKLAHCPGCEVGKIRRAPARRVVKEGPPPDPKPSILKKEEEHAELFESSQHHGTNTRGPLDSRRHGYAGPLTHVNSEKIDTYDPSHSVTDKGEIDTYDPSHHNDRGSRDSRRQGHAGPLTHGKEKIDTYDPSHPNQGGSHDSGQQGYGWSMTHRRPVQFADVAMRHANPALPEPALHEGDMDLDEDLLHDPDDEDAAAEEQKKVER